jgi:hypothetical protein
VVTVVRITVTLVGRRTGTGDQVQEETIQPQIETLVRGFVESPERGSQISFQALIDFVQSASGLFVIRASESSLVAEHLGTGQVDRDVEVVELGTGQVDRDVEVVELDESERAELASLILRLE